MSIPKERLASVEYFAVSKVAMRTMANLNMFWVKDREKQIIDKKKKMTFNQFMDIQHNTFHEVMNEYPSSSRKKA